MLGCPCKQTEIRLVTIMSMYRYTTSCLEGIRHHDGLLMVILADFNPPSYSC